MLSPKSLLKKGLARVFPHSAVAGTTNEPTRVAWIEKTLKAMPAGGTILDAGAGERQAYMPAALFVDSCRATRT